MIGRLSAKGTVPLCSRPHCSLCPCDSSQPIEGLGPFLVSASKGVRAELLNSCVLKLNGATVTGERPVVCSSLLRLPFYALLLKEGSEYYKFYNKCTLDSLYEVKITIRNRR